MMVKIFFLGLLLLQQFFDVGGQSKLVCPAVRTTSGWLDLFPLPCRKNSECSVMGGRHLCCKGYCTKALQQQDAQVAQNVENKLFIELNSSPLTNQSPTTSLPPETPATTSSTTSTTTTTTPRPTTTSTTTRTTTTTTTTSKPTTTASESLLSPFFKVLPIVTTPKQTKATQKASKSAPAKSSDKSAKLLCPKELPAILFPIPCEKTSQCKVTSGPDQVCCSGKCVKGVRRAPPTTPEPRHQPLLGFIPRECPTEPLGELLFEVQECKTDADCWPRLCCADGKNKYCRTAKARLDLVPVASRINEPVRAVEQYLQCTPPPARDIYPRSCTSSVDCFPNLCCAEGGKKFCRPPMRSILALLAGVSQRVGSRLVNFRSRNDNAT